MRRLPLRRLVGALGVRAVAVALTVPEQKLLIRAVRELAEREDYVRDDSVRAADVLEMLENAPDVGALAALAPDTADDDPVHDDAAA
jgi:hypothetical protein